MEINWTSILGKAEVCMKTPKMKKGVQEKIDKYMLGGVSFTAANGKMVKSPAEAASTFINILQDEILSHQGARYAYGDIDPSSINSLLQLDCSKPYRVGNQYCIDIYFSNDLHRKSLNPARYNGIENIVALLNSGYSAGHRTYGYWESAGEKIASLANRDGAHFIEQAIRNFTENYASEYGITDIKVADIYK